MSGKVRKQLSDCRLMGESLNQLFRQFPSKRVSE